MKRRIAITGGSGFIGTNLVEHFRGSDQVVNLDRSAPRSSDHTEYWQSVDLQDPAAVAARVRDFDPTHVLHFGARTDLGGSTLADYAVNTDGTQNLLAAVRECPNLERLILASSLLVCENGYRPSTDTDYCPTTAYGLSKQRMEEAIRASLVFERCTIVRPTSIWGPWFATPYRDFFDAVLARRYVHPGRETVVKATGFVGNTVAQIDAILSAPVETVSMATFYLADWPARSIEEWASAIATAAGVGDPFRVPIPILQLAALAGDLLQRAGVDAPPLTSFRLNNLRTSSSYETERLAALTGPLPYPLEDGVARTLEWIASTT